MSRLQEWRFDDKQVNKPVSTSVLCKRKVEFTLWVSTYLDSSTSKSSLQTIGTESNRYTYMYHVSHMLLQWD